MKNIFRKIGLLLAIIFFISLIIGNLYLAIKDFNMGNIGSGLLCLLIATFPIGLIINNIKKLKSISS